MSRSRSAIRTWMGSITFLVVTMAAALITSPLILRALGETRFGVLRSLSEAFAYLTLVSQGITIALVPRLVATMGVGDRAGASRVLSTGVRLHGAAAVIVTLIGLIATPAVGMLIRTEPALQGEVRTAWLVGLLAIPLITLAPLKILTEVDHKGYLTQLLMTVQALVTSVLMVLLTRDGWGIVGAMIATVVGATIFSISLLAYTLWAYPELSRLAVQARPTREDWGAVRSLSGPTLLAILAERVSVLSDSLVLTSIRGGAAATILFVTQKLVDISRLILSAIGSSIWPGLTELLAQGERDTFNLRLIEVTRLVMLLGVAGMVPTVAYNSIFVARWMGPQVDGGLAIAAVAALNAMLLTLLSLFSYPFAATGRVRLVAGSAVISALINVVASVIFSKLLGPIGPLLGTTTAVLSVGAWYLPLQLHRVFGTSLSDLARALVTPLPWGVGYWLLVSWAARSHTPAGWFALGAEMGAWASGFVALGTWTVLGPEDRRLWKARLIDPIMSRFARQGD